MIRAVFQDSQYLYLVKDIYNFLGVTVSGGTCGDAYVAIPRKRAGEIRKFATGEAGKPLELLAYSSFCPPLNEKNYSCPDCGDKVTFDSDCNFWVCVDCDLFWPDPEQPGRDKKALGEEPSSWDVVRWVCDSAPSPRKS